MALTEIQLPEKADFYRDLQSVAGEVKSRGIRWKQFADFINTMDASDVTNIGISAELLADLQGFRIALNAIVTAIDGQDTVMDAFRKPLIL